MENKFDRSLRFVYDLVDYLLLWQYDGELLNFNIIVKERLEHEDMLQFKNTVCGLILVTPVIYNDGNVSYTVICINRISHLIHCANTNGDTLNCETFSSLCNLKDEARYFSCIQYNYNRDPYHEFVLVNMLYYFTTHNGTHNYEINKGFYFLCRDMMPFCRTDDGINFTQPLNFYVLALQRYPDMHPNIRRCVENHIKKQTTTLDEKGLQQLLHKEWLGYDWKGLEKTVIDFRESREYLKQKGAIY